MIDHNSTEVWTGDITYGNYSNDTWYSVGGWNHPRFKAYLKEVKALPNLFEGFNLYVTGGLLEDWHSWDIDWVLTGPYEPEKIKMAMQWITMLGFKHKLYPDIHYSKEIFSLYDWQNNGTEYSDWLYELSNVFIKNGLKSDTSFMEPIDGMYRRWNNYPFEKNIKKHTEGYKYSKPVQIF